jgi:hypothetical protein
MAKVNVPAPGGTFAGATTDRGRTPGGRFNGDGISGFVPQILEDSILWIGPNPPTGSQYILWINTEDARWYGKWNDGDSLQWVDLSLPFGEGLPGPQGAQGARGLTGPIGIGIPTGGSTNEILVKIDGTDYNTTWGVRPLDGLNVLTGTSVPSDVGDGVDSEHYINTTTWEIFGPKAAGVWPAGVSLIGPTGPTGLTGTSTLTGVIDPTTEGNDGDVYINTATYDHFGPKAAGVWPAGVSLLGTDGNTVLNGVVAPTTEGVDGDFFIDTALNDIYGPKAGGSWAGGTSLVGPQGTSTLTGVIDPTTEGNDGDVYINTATYDHFGPKAGGSWPAGVSLLGTDGNTVLNGIVAPTTEGVDGDFFIDTVLDQIYGPKAAGVWGSATDLFGADGLGVPAGGTTDQVLSKIDGTDNNTYWATPAVALPAGGTTDQVLAKLSATDGDADWVDNVSGPGAILGSAVTKQRIALIDFATDPETLGTGNELTLNAALIDGYTQIEIIVRDATGVTGVSNLLARTSIDDGTLWDVTATNYKRHIFNVFGDGYEDTASETGAVIGGDNVSQSSFYTIRGLGDATVKTMFEGVHHSTGNSGVVMVEKATAEAENALLLYIDNGTNFTSGTLEVIGYKDVDLTTAGAAAYDFRLTFQTAPTASEVLERIILPREVVLSGDIAGTASLVGVNPTATFDIDIQDDGVSVGTISISTGGVVTTTTAGGLRQVLAAGSKIEFIAPAGVDGTIADVDITVPAESLGSLGGFTTFPAVTPTVRDSGTYYLSSGSSTSATFPAGALEGDKCIILATGAWQASVPAGWSDLMNAVITNHQGRAFTKILDAADIIAGNVTVSWTGSFAHTYSVVVFEGDVDLQYVTKEFYGAGIASDTHNIYDQAIGDKVILFGTNRATASANTSDTGSLLSTIGGTDASAAIYQYDPVATGPYDVVWSYSVSGTGHGMFALAAAQVPASVYGITLNTVLTADSFISNDLLRGDIWQDVNPSAGDITLTALLSATGSQPVTFENIDVTNHVIFAASGATINSLNGLRLPPGGVAVLMPKGSGVYRLMGDLIV